MIHLSFAELFLASGYTLNVEAVGHSGIRAYWPHPLLAPVLGPLGMELAIEDHDLHHRYFFSSWLSNFNVDANVFRYGRGGKNFGKQTRVWDVLFGTVAPREEEGIYASQVNSKKAAHRKSEI